MKILTATKQTQGARKSDFSFVPEGEPVELSWICDGNDTIDGGCGCQRSLCGVKSRTATTTMVIREANMTFQEYASLLNNDTEVARITAAENLLRLAEQFPVGAVIELRETGLQVRNI